MRRLNGVKEVLRSGGVVLGSFIRTASLEMAEILACSGFDFVTVDTEHGSISPERILEMVVAIENQAKVAVVRVAENSPKAIMAALDAGAAGIHVPKVASRAEAIAAVQSTHYPPAGQRGVALVTRAAGYGLMQRDEYLKFARDETVLIIAVEDAETIGRLPEILEVHGIDVVFVGHSDLSGSLGLTGQIDHPRVQKAIDDILNIVTRKGVVAGIPAYTPEAVERRVKQGFRYITTTAEGLFLKACQEYQEARKVLKD